MSKKYEDILYLSRPSSPRKKMSNLERAAQFAPFAALNGHSEAMLETARLTEDKIILSEEEIDTINKQLSFLKENKSENIEITYFLEDKRKTGGSYIHTIGRIKKIDEIEKVLYLDNQTKIKLENIIKIKSNLFTPF